MIDWILVAWAWLRKFRDPSRTKPPAPPSIGDLMAALIETNTLLLSTREELRICNRRLAQLNLAQLAFEGRTINHEARIEQLEADFASLRDAAE